MFGHQDDNTQPQTMPAEPWVQPPAQPAGDAPAGDAAQQPNPANGFHNNPATATPPLLDAHETDGHTDNNPAVPAPDDTAPPASDDANALLDIKQQALTDLSPLVDHLDQSPEEKFRTTMMMIQASDNQALLKTAYDAAQKIEDEKVRAQALLDVINEINYFTQQHEA